ncbi:MAG: YdiU family protein [Pseudomonadota bacterium]
MANRHSHQQTPLLDLGERCFAPVEPADFPQAILRYRNDRAAAEIGLDGLSSETWIQHFARFEPFADNLPKPLALAYHGHQFRVYNPDIGDGRGFTFAQFRDARGRLMDLGTKGSGRTPYSRTGDGRLTLKGAIREILATELLEALGVPTSRTLSVIETGEQLARDDEPSPARSAVLVRLSHSHVRFGSFQRLAFLSDTEGLRVLLAYAVRNFYPHLSEDDAPGFLRSVAQNMAKMTARLMTSGFVHGVLNTDNMNVTGECFDYGPWRFLPTLKPGLTAAYFDVSGLYAYARQAEAIYWNLSALADALRTVADLDALKAALDQFPAYYGAAFAEALMHRLGVRGAGDKSDQDFVTGFFGFLNETQVPFERAFFDLFGGRAGLQKRERSPHARAYRDAAIIEQLDGYEPVGADRLADPFFEGAPETLLYDEVEALWSELEPGENWAALEEKIARIRRMGAAYRLEAAL